MKKLMKAEEYIKDKLKEYETAEMGGSFYLFRYEELVKILNDFTELKQKEIFDIETIKNNDKPKHISVDYSKDIYMDNESPINIKKLKDIIHNNICHNKNI